MTNKLFAFVPLLALSLLPFAARAQAEGCYRYQDARELWRLTQNAAGLAIDRPYTSARGYAEFDLQHRSGQLHRVQEGGQRNQLLFNAERYQSVGRYLRGYGRFTFGMDRTKERAWADVMRPYDSNPFFTGSSVKGKYDTQLFDLSAALGTIPIPLSGGINRELLLGARLDYKVGDQSRLRDPRSRNELLQYRVSPAAVFQTSSSVSGEHAVGISGYYDRRKEKLPGLTTVQEDPNLVYYVMTGLEAVTGSVGGYKGFSREWVSHELGAELSYNYSDGKVFNSLTTLSAARAAEDAWGQYKYSPGKYTSFIYKAATRNRLTRGRLLHQLDLEVSLAEGYADEYRQQLVQERDAATGYTSFRYDTQITYRKRYQVHTHDVSLHYRCSATADAAVTGYAGLAASLQGATDKHLLHTSELSRQRARVALEGGYALLQGRLWLDAVAAYCPSVKASLLLADPESDYARQVLLPDMQYYDATLWQGQLSAKYVFPVKVKQVSSQAYVKAYFERQKADDHRSLKSVGITLGVYN